MLKTLIYILITLVVVIGILFLYLITQFGKTPNSKEAIEYEKLSYYKDGQFQSPQKLHYNFNQPDGKKINLLRFFTKSEHAPKTPLPKIILNKSSFPTSPEDYAIYWLGHSAAIMEIADKRLIFDPVLDNAAPIPLAVRRFDKAPITREDFPFLDYIIITHNHYDHLEKKTIQSIKTGKFIVPLGVGAALEGWGINKNRIIELGWDETFDDGKIKITATEGLHYSSRNFYDKNKTLWNSYVIKTKEKNIFWAGDTGYSNHFKRIGKLYGPFDLVALEIDGWNTMWPNTHMFPNEVVKATIDLGGKNLLPIHWGVFDLAMHPLSESIDMVIEESKNKNFNILTPLMGEKIKIGTENTSTKKWWKNVNF